MPPATKRGQTSLIVLDSDDEETNATPIVTEHHGPVDPIPRASSSTVPPTSSKTNPKRKAGGTPHPVSINDALMSKKVHKPVVEKAHSTSRHSIKPALACRPKLLEWYDRVKHQRGMPWRKDYDASLSRDAITQRAYEVLISEIMLQQTQITTVIPYYNAWMEAFPTVQALADADIEAVNQRWKGLGYYSRAARLLATAKKVVEELEGCFPSDAATMEKQLPGVGRYTAGAVCSIVWNEKTPAVDGNVQRLLSRVLALHAPLKGTKAKEPLEVVWKAAHRLVKDTPDAGALNQSLIELGSTICKPTNPACGGCPLRDGCGAYKLAQSRVPPEGDIEDLCTLCEPFPDASSAVTRFPFKVEKKKARESACAVNVVSWTSDEGERWVILVRRPETGLLAGLYEFPTLPLEAVNSSTLDTATPALLETYIADTSLPTKSHKSKDAGSLLHVFSHIRMTYHVRNITLDQSTALPRLRQPSELELASMVPGAEADDLDAEDDEEDDAKPAKKKQKTAKGSTKTGKGKVPSSAPGNPMPRVRWVRASEVEGENISTGALKIWKQVEGIASTKKAKKR